MAIGSVQAAGGWKSFDHWVIDIGGGVGAGISERGR